MSLELCLFRHGRTAWNALGRYQGLADVGLDDLGRGQAHAVGERCRAMQPTALWSSDLRRCREVAQQIGDTTGLTMQLDSRLRERDVGRWSGLVRAEIAEQFADEFAAWQVGDPDVHPGGGESAREVEQRVSSVLAAIVASSTEGSVVAVTHAGWIRSAVQLVLGDGAARQRVGVPSQGSLTVLSFADDGLVTLEAFNDRGHLGNVEPVDREPPAPDIV